MSAQLIATLLGLPRQLLYSPTDRCNLRCFMCSTHGQQATSRGRFYDMPAETFTALEPVLDLVAGINIAVAGEPLLAKNLSEQFERIHQLNPFAQISMISNGLLFARRELAEQVLPHLNHLRLSVCGQERYEDIHIGGTRERLRTALATIRDIRKTTGHPERVWLEFILMKRNKDDIVPVAKLVDEFDFELVHFKDLWVVSEELLAESFRHDEALAKDLRARLTTVKTLGLPMKVSPWPEFDTTIPSPPTSLGRQLKAILTHPRYAIKSIRDKMLTRLLSHHGVACQYPWQQTLVEKDGETRFCCEGRTVLGNLNEQSFAAIWFGDEARRYREGMLTKQYYKACATCKFVTGSAPDAFLTFQKKD